MSKPQVDNNMLKKLRLKYESSILPRKYGVNYDQLLNAGSPENNLHLDKLFDLFPLEKNSVRNIYTRYIGPVYPSCPSPKVRRVYINRLHAKRGAPLDNIGDLPDNLKLVAVYARRNKLIVNSVVRCENPISKTKLFINGWLCGIYHRTKAVSYQNGDYIQFAIKACALKKLDFVIMSWNPDDQSPQFFIIPAVNLLRSKNPQERMVFNIPIKKTTRVRKNGFHWHNYLNAWHELKQ